MQELHKKKHPFQGSSANNLIKNTKANSTFAIAYPVHKHDFCRLSLFPNLKGFIRLNFSFALFVLDKL